MAGWHHWLNGQAGLACCNSWSCKESVMTEWLNWIELRGHVGITSELQRPFKRLFQESVHKMVQACMLSRFSPVWLFRPYGLYPARLLCPWDSPGKNTEVGCHTLLQEIFQGTRWCWLEIECWDGGKKTQLVDSKEIEISRLVDELWWGGEGTERNLRLCPVFGLGNLVIGGGINWGKRGEASSGWV